MWQLFCNKKLRLFFFLLFCHRCWCRRRVVAGRRGGEAQLEANRNGGPYRVPSSQGGESGSGKGRGSKASSSASSSHGAGGKPWKCPTCDQTNSAASCVVPSAKRGFFRRGR